MKKSINFEILRIRYHQNDRKNKTKLLNELCDLYGYNRKYLLQVFNGLTKKQYVRRGRKKVYNDKELLEPLKRIWLACDQMCSKKLKVAIPLWLPFYEECYEPLSAITKMKLISVSPATIDRLLKPKRVHYKRRGLCGTKPGYLLKNQIEIKTEHWDVSQPGFMEADTVAHGGNSTEGDFVWSITLTDIMTGWTEIRATWNKGEVGVFEGIKDIEANLPFNILGFDSDNGGEFINWHLKRYFEGKNVQFTRSRPYHKNDNAHVEQKNWTHVRHLFGYDRFDNFAVVKLMNNLYRNEWSLYQNHFIPTMKLISKVKINSKYQRQYEYPKTPYQRLLESEYISEEIKRELIRVHEKLNPFKLKVAIETQLKIIFSLVLRNKKPRSKF